jgi:hypothetical protein
MAGNTLNTAFNIGTLTGTRTFNDFVGVVDPVDYYRFTLADTSAISLLLNGLTQSSLYTRIIYDRNNNGLIDNGEVLYNRSAFVGSNGIINATLGAGTYFVEVYPDWNVNSSYNLELTATPRPSSLPFDPGNTLNTAYNLGTLTGTRILNDFVGVVDPVDYYRFTLADTNAIGLVLNGLTQSSLYTRIIYDRNNNGLIDNGEVLYNRSAFVGSNGIINATLGAGTYFVEVYPDWNVNSSYSLELTATPRPSSLPFDPGNTLNTAYNLGTLTGTRILNDFVGVVDGVDYYRFTLADTSAIGLVLNGLTQSTLYTRIIYDKNNNGLIDNGEILYSRSAFVGSNGIINATLGAGTYFVEVYPDWNVNSSYSLTLSNFTNTTTPQVVKDLNRDSKTDILLTNPSQGLHKAWLMNGINYAGEIQISLPAGYRPAAMADFNKDGKTDIVASNPNNGWNIISFLDGGNSIGQVGLPTTPGWEIKGAADFNGDGNIDILLNNTANHWNIVWFLGGNNGVTYTDYANLPSAPGWNITGVADFNNDGKPDILLNDPRSGWNIVWFLDGTNYMGYADLGITPGWQTVGTGDFNSDGRADIIFNNINEGWNAVWFMDGTNWLGAASLPTTPAGWEIAGMG